jgi:hypothetical protein
MNPVIVMIVFVLQGKAVGAQIVGSTNSVIECQQAAADIIADKAGQEPKGDSGKAATPFPVCIDTHPMVETLADGPKVST